jgi:hypothetical protein
MHWIVEAEPEETDSDQFLLKDIVGKTKGAPANANAPLQMKEKPTFWLAEPYTMS